MAACPEKRKPVKAGDARHIQADFTAPGIYCRELSIDDGGVGPLGGHFAGNNLHS